MTKSVFTRKHEHLRQLLVDARKSAKLTQADLAKRLSRPQSFVSKIERGERRLDVVEFFEVAQRIGIDAYAFLRTLNEENGSQEGHPGLENRSRGKLVSCGKFARSREWQVARKKLHTAIKKVEWPSGSGKFTIYPESGKKRNRGNGVTPIKNGLMVDLKRQGYRLEGSIEAGGKRKFGKFDAVFDTKYGPVVVEWETGNISSSHRSLNKMALFLLKGKIAAGTLIVPTRELYKYLTDRVGNMQELEPYLEFWRSIPCKQGVLEIVAIEHDATSTKVPRIRKGTSGRALA